MSGEFKTISHEQWVKKYRPTSDEMLIDFPEKIPTERIWTQLEADEEIVISAGVHMVNRLGWWVTVNSHDFMTDVIDED